jgi:SAM-dependent methyltransferase
MNDAEWFAGWFDSPYYHLLYSHRDHSEAERFIDNICRWLNLPKGAKLWDLACGKGRHSLALSKRGYTVTGTDLSDNSISEASKNSSETLEFLVQDMRAPFRESYFDAVFNLFTSIGYFDNYNDNFLVFKNVSLALRPGGRFVVDFFNSEKVKSAPSVEKVEERSGISFATNKTVRDNTVVKSIRFSDKGTDYAFEERVSLLLKSDFLAFSAAARMSPVAIFGNYDLGAFDPASSDRMIIVFEKP